MASGTIAHRGFATITGKLPSSTGFSTEVPYPTGFSINNCAMVSFEIWTGAVWRTGTNVSGITSPRTFAQADTGGISVYTNESSFFGNDWRVMLMLL